MRIVLRAASLAVCVALLLALVPGAAVASPASVASPVAALGIPTMAADPHDPADGTPAGAVDLTGNLGGFDGGHGWGKAALEETRAFSVARGSLKGFESDSDWFRVDVDPDSVSFGLAYLLETRSLAPGVHPVIEVYGPATTDTVKPSKVASLPLTTDPGAAFSASDSPWSVTAAGLTTLDFVPAKAGRYFFRARPWLGQADGNGVPQPLGSSDGAGPYTLRVKVGLTTRVKGDTRFLTAIAVSRESFSDGALAAGGAVVIANGMTYADALAGSVLAGAVRGPLLLTHSGYLDTEVADEIRRLGAKRAFILGGPKSLTPKVAADLVAPLGGGPVTRVKGDTRVETAAEIAKRAAAEMPRSVRPAGAAAPGSGRRLSRLAFVTNGWGYADALSASPMATHGLAPILLTHAKSLDTSVTETIDALGITDVVILGGTGSVSAEVEADLKAKLNGDGLKHVKRIGGPNRYATSVLVAKWATGGLGATASVGTTAAPDLLPALDWRTPAFATGQDFPDALGGGVMCGLAGTDGWPPSRPGHPLLLTPRGSLSEWVLDVHGVLPKDSAFLDFTQGTRGYVGRVTRCYVFGGDPTIAEPVLATLDAVVGGEPAAQR